MKRPIPNGMLVAVEGIDGAGKTSVATLLAQWCGERGLGCTISKEPTGLHWGTELRKSAKAGRLSLERELELFSLDRQEHIKRCIIPSLEEGNIVILDRYYWSSAAYQGGRGANYQQIIEANEKFAPKPDLFMVLDIDVDAGLQRIRMRGDQPNLFEGKGSLRKAKHIFCQLAEKNSNARLVDASGHLKQTFAIALQKFQEVAMNKLASSGPLHPEMVNLVLDFFGGDRIAGPYPPGTPELNALLSEAKKRSV